MGLGSGPSGLPAPVLRGSAKSSWMRRPLWKAVMRAASVFVYAWADGFRAAGSSSAARKTMS